MDYSASNKRKSEFDEIYRQEILPKIQFYENLRHKELKKFRIKSNLYKIFTILSIIYIPVWFLLLTRSDEYYKQLQNFVFLFLFLGALAMFLIFLLPTSYILLKQKTYFEFKKNIKKNNLVSDLLKPFGDIKWYSNDIRVENSKLAKIPNELIEESGLFAKYDSRFTDDEFSGVYNGVNFLISETKMIYPAHPQHNFSGIIISFDINKKIKNRTIVVSKKDFTSKDKAYIYVLFIVLIAAALLILFNIGFLDYKSQGLLLDLYIIFSIVVINIFIITIFAKFIIKSLKEKEHLDKVTLEDTKFSNRFNVYSSDQIEARYLVTPAFMERLYNLETAFGQKNVKCSFFANKLMISIFTKKDLFEICTLDKSTKQVVKDLYNELNSIYEMIDYFKLDEKLYPTE